MKTPKIPKIKIKCKECPYYTGIQCHGHGDYWGECTLYEDKHKVLKAIFEKEDGLYVDHKDVWSLTRNDNSTCAFFEITDLRD